MPTMRPSMPRWWRCCNGHDNNPELSPRRCPICGDVRGNHCYIYHGGNGLKPRSQHSRADSATTSAQHQTGSAPLVAPEVRALVRRGQQFHLPLLVEGQQYETMPDSGCSVNIVHPTLLANLQNDKAVTYSHEPLESILLEIADGQVVEVIGLYYLSCAFLD